MLFPKGQAIYENLITSFAQLDALLAELKSNQFSGYVRVAAWEYEGILLLDTGKIVNAFQETQGQRHSGVTAGEGIIARAKEKDATISVYRLPAETVQLLAGVLQGEPIHKDLSSDFTSLEKLIARLQSERHTGYIEIRMVDPKQKAAIFMSDGKVVENILSTNGEIMTGSKVLEQIQAAASKGAFFTVYRADLARVYSQDVDLSESFARQETLALWQEILKQIETVVDSTTKAETFSTAFKRACIDHATTYPFLDPFAAEFEYRDGQIKFVGQARVTQFNQGLSECLAQTVRQLAAETPGRNLAERMQPVISELKDKYNARLEEIGLTTALPEMFGT